mmetsp:Transcript_16828/g.41399  ORF Transcript_16828/g.41399 Transcript_16828/m.41399 type:complete len:110 (-) Transcript_16828:292-621(-)
MPIPGEAHPTFAVGGLVLGGGLLGFLKSGSKASLIGSSVVSAAYAGAGYLITNGDGFQGHALASTAAISLVGMFGKKFMKTRSLFPPGFYAMLGLASLAFHGKKALEWK